MLQTSTVSVPDIMSSTYKRYLQLIARVISQLQNTQCTAYRWDRKNHPKDLLNIQTASFHSQKKKKKINFLMMNLRPLKGHQEAALKAYFNIFCSPKKASVGKWCFPLKCISPEMNTALQKDIRKRV